MKKFVTAGVSALILAGSAVGAWSTVSKVREDWYVRNYGIAPHASVIKLNEVEKFVEVIAQFSQGEINARQVQRQVQIDELKHRCAAGRCSPYDRQSLGNLLEAWSREQATLESLRRQAGYPSRPPMVGAVK